MNKLLYIISLNVILLFINSCISQKPEMSVSVGINHGGMVENTDLSVVPNVQATPESEIDAYSGATHLGVNAGINANIPLKKNELETGFIYMYNYQEFSYADQGNMYIGVRKFHVNQIMFPLTYNFLLFKRLLPNSETQLKFGYLGQINLINANGTGILPEYTINRWANGATMGLSAYPFQFGNGSKLGFDLSVYRGSQIYTDYYNQKEFEMQGSSFVKLGLRYKFN